MPRRGLSPLKYDTLSGALIPAKAGIQTQSVTLLLDSQSSLGMTAVAPFILSPIPENGFPGYDFPSQIRHPQYLRYIQCAAQRL
jgi:hypothetical protein